MGTQDTLSTYVFGKVQPSAIDLEQAVLGAMLIDRDAVSEMLDALRAETFYTESHQIIFRAIKSLYEKSEPVDILTVTEQLKSKASLDSIGGGYYLVELTHMVASSANIEYHSRILVQKEMQRRIIEVAAKATRDAYEDTTDAFKLLGETEQGIFEISKRLFNKDAVHISSATRDVLLRIEAATKNNGVTGVETGIYQFDKEVGGLQDGNLYILAARPGMGKTALILTAAMNIAKTGKPVGLFSLEMSAEQLTGRAVSAESGVSGHKLNNGELEEKEWPLLQSAVETINALPIYIDETPGLSLMAVRTRARRMVQKYGAVVILVDYLQLMTGDDGKEVRKSGNREQEIASIARGLKNLAKELGVPVIALSQLSRAVETRGGSKRPQMSDLRESGEIENAADFCGFLYRPAYYQILEREDGQVIPDGHTELIIGKHRHGKSGIDIPMKFVDRLCLFQDVDQDLQFYGGAGFSTQFPATQPSQAQPDRFLQAIGSSRPNTDGDIPF